MQVNARPDGGGVGSGTWATTASAGADSRSARQRRGMLQREPHLQPLWTTRLGPQASDHSLVFPVTSAQPEPPRVTSVKRRRSPSPRDNPGGGGGGRKRVRRGARAAGVPPRLLSQDTAIRQLPGPGPRPPRRLPGLARDRAARREARPQDGMPAGHVPGARCRAAPPAPRPRVSAGEATGTRVRGRTPRPGRDRPRIHAHSCAHSTCTALTALVLPRPRRSQDPAESATTAGTEGHGGRRAATHRAAPGEPARAQGGAAAGREAQVPRGSGRGGELGGAG